jgi:hypothetical protein
MESSVEKQDRLAQDQVRVITRDFYLGIVGALLIVLGYVFSENSQEYPGMGNGVAGLVMFLTGWVLFFAAQSHNHAWARGVALPIIAVIAYVYFTYVLKRSPSERRILSIVTLAIIVVYLGVWGYYAYVLTLDPHTQEVLSHRAGTIWTGFVLMILGMTGTFVFREKDWYDITGGIIPKYKTVLPMDVFNPFLPVLSFGWLMMATGNSFQTVSHY